MSIRKSGVNSALCNTHISLSPSDGPWGQVSSNILEYKNGIIYSREKIPVLKDESHLLNMSCDDITYPDVCTDDIGLL